VRERGVEVATEAVVRAPVQVVRSQQRKSRWGRREDVQDSNDSGASVARRCLQVLGFRV
jgi:methylmalonyl-CoA mutase cobalamin-binding subunit